MNGKKWANRMGAAAASLLLLTSAGCSLDIEQTLSVAEGSEIGISTSGRPADVLPLNGRTVIGIDVSIGFFDLLFGRISGDVDVLDLLIAAPGFDLFGNRFLNTEELCIIPDGAVPPGSFNANLFRGTTTFAVDIETIALVGNETIAELLPGGGLPFPFNLDSQVPLGLFDLLGLASGNGDLSLTQTIDQAVTIAFDFDGPDGPLPTSNLPTAITGEITLESVDSFSTTPLFETCVARLLGG